MRSLLFCALAGNHRPEEAAPTMAAEWVSSCLREAMVFS